MTDLHEIPLPGLDGANPLGFLAALGTWRTTDAIHPGTRMYWKPIGGHWAPVLTIRGPFKTVSLLKGAAKRLQKSPPIFSKLEKNLNIRPTEFHDFANETIKLGIQDSMDWLAAIGSDAVYDVPQGKTDYFISVTEFRLLSGSGRQDFIPTLSAVISKTTLKQCLESILHPWTYKDEKLGLRWDPLEDKRYALRWKNPSPDPTMTQHGANRLAIEALPLLPTAPVGTQLETTGFTGHKSNNTCFTWPVWDASIPIDTARSLLALRELQTDAPDPAPLRSRGITAIFRSQRITNGKFRNFTPAVQVG